MASEETITFLGDIAIEWNQYTILTFDEDFSEIQNLFSFPPKIIWLRTGNVSTNEIAQLLIKLKNDIDEFMNNDELGIYEIYIP